MCLQVEQIDKTHGRSLQVAHNISFTIEDGQLGALIGPSGCGKTTLLRMIAGFETPDKGRIRIGGREVFSGKVQVPPEKRKTGMVFQDYALFPHLTVMENITYGPVNHDKKEIAALIEVTGLGGSEKKYPHELSGGQQQRVALARAIAPKPGLLLMDEPFSNLDVSLRENLSEEVRFILNEYRITGLLVTHHQHEAFAMADKIGVMMNGRLLQWDAAHTLYYEPDTYEVARFVGEGSVVPGIVQTDGTIESPLGRICQPTPGNRLNGSNVTLFFRPENLVVDSSAAVRARLIKSHFRGPGRFHTFRLESGEEITCLDQCPKPLRLNEDYGIRVEGDKIRAFY